MDLFEARDLDGIIEMMTQHRGLAVEAVARWEARSLVPPKVPLPKVPCRPFCPHFCGYVE